ncbi:MAG: type II toxin-antitoxin system prevent-host-death family antitoxin [Candidatus Saccharimonadales bacterium]
MDKVITIYDAKTNLSKLVKQAKAGQTIYIGAYGTAEVMLTPLPIKNTVQLGVWQGKHKITYSDVDLMQSDTLLAKTIEQNKVMPDGSF